MRINVRSSAIARDVEIVGALDEVERLLVDAERDSISR
jgi:hypothetical protein